MSIHKCINSNNKGNDAFKRSLDYILDPTKTSNAYISGNGVNVETAYADMNTVQQLLRKSSGRRYIHYILSFDLGVSAQTAYTVSQTCADYYSRDYQYVLAIHSNTPNIHAHIIMSTVNIHTGKKFNQSPKDFFRFREYINECLVENGLEPIHTKTANKLVVEEFQQNGMFEANYKSIQNTLFTQSNTFSEVDSLEAYRTTSCFFGSIDLDEAIEILQAEQADKIRWEIIHYFEGTSSSLPLDVSFQEAEEIYEQWLQSQPNFDEEDIDHGYFSKHFGHINT